MNDLAPTGSRFAIPPEERPSRFPAFAGLLGLCTINRAAAKGGAVDFRFLDRRMRDFPSGWRGGVRLRYLNDGARYLVEPRLSGVRPLTPELRLKFGAGIYHQYLQLVATEGFSAGDFYVPIDETAPPSRSWQSVLGLDWTPAPRYRVVVEGYYTGLSALVTLDNNSPPEPSGLTAQDIFITGGRGHQSGVEFFVERRIGAVTGWVGYTLGWTRRTFDEINGGKTYPPKYDRRHDFNAVGQYRRGKWKFGANAVYASGQAFTPASAQWAATAAIDPMASE